MKIIVMDESRKDNLILSELLQKKKYRVVSCQNTPAFMDALTEGGADRVLLNVDSWQRGRAIYKFFDIPNRLSAVPVTFYNAPDNFVNIPARVRNEMDRVLAGETQLEAVAETAV